MQLNTFVNRLYDFLNNRKISLIYIPLAIYWSLIFVATSIPTDEIPHLFKFQDKFEHFTAYFLLAILFSFTLHFQEKYIALKKRFFIFSLLILIFYGAIDEIHQMFIPGRIADIYDWLADVIGGSFGIVLSYFVIMLGQKNKLQNIS